MKLLIMGPPGVGKGTQAKTIKTKLNIVHISTGDLLRYEIMHNTDTGILTKKYIDEGKLVPDSILLDMVKKRISHKDCEKGFILDGFPRTIPQATGLDDILKELKQSLHAVVSLSANENELVNRLIKRGAESGRSDDTPDIIRKRQTVYWEETAPLLDFYRKKNLLKTIDGLGKIEVITKRILDIIK